MKLETCGRKDVSTSKQISVNLMNWSEAGNPHPSRIPIVLSIRKISALHQSKVQIAISSPRKGATASTLPAQLRIYISSISATPLPSNPLGPISSKRYPSGEYLSPSSPGILRPKARVIHALGPHLLLKDGLTYQGYERYSTALYRSILGSGARGIYCFRMNSGRGGRSDGEGIYGVLKGWLLKYVMDVMVEGVFSSVRMLR